MSPYLYVTLDGTVDNPDSYRGIVVEDVREDYQEVVRFYGSSFADDVTQYLAWADGQLQRNEALEIYESDVLCNKIKALQP